jgi:hypothetical protein
MFIRGRRGQTAAIYATLLLLASAFALIAPTVLADDGGIPENGGWGNLANNMWLVNELIRRGYPASAAAVLAASWISGLFSPPVLSKVKPLGDDDHYVDKQYTDATPGDNKITTWRYIKDPTGTFVDSAGNRYRREETRGLSKVVIDAEDSPDLGLRVRMFTFEPPQDQGLKNDIRDEIMDIDRTHLDRLHPDNWKNLTTAQRTETIKELGKALQKGLGVDYDLEVVNDPDKGLGGSFRRAYTTTNADGTTTEHRALLKINANGDAMDDPRTAIRTLIHENRHAYQKKAADPNGTDYQRITHYNNNNIQSSSVDYVRYGESFNERDARSFGHDTTNQVIGDLNNMWGH